MNGLALFLRNVYQLKIIHHILSMFISMYHAISYTFLLIHFLIIQDVTFP